MYEAINNFHTTVKVHDYWLTIFGKAFNKAKSCIALQYSQMAHKQERHFSFQFTFKLA